MSLADLCARAGVSKAYLHRLEKSEGHIHPSVEVARRLADALGLDAAAIVGSQERALRLPSGLAAYAAQTPITEADLAALAALVPFAGEDVSPQDWKFAHDALRRSVLSRRRAVGAHRG
jgi:transcriptional regulator with XRE-family HTH domain